MKRIYILSIIPMITLLNACKQETPNCSSDDARKVVFDIVKEELGNPNSSYWSRVIDKLSFKLNDVRTSKHDKELDSYLCSANLEGKLTEKDIQTALDSIKNEQKSEYDRTELMLKNGYNEFSLKIDEKEKNSLQELEKEYSHKKKSFYVDKDKIISDTEQKLLENENHYRRMSNQIEIDVRNYKKAGATDKEASEALDKNKKELSNNYNHHKDRFNQERNEKIKNIENNLKVLEESYPKDINKTKDYFKQEKENYLSEAQDQLDKMTKKHNEIIDYYRNQYNNGIKVPIRYKIESSNNGKDFYVTIQ